MQIRDERREDFANIYTLIQSAFSDKDFSSGTEGPIVNGLRQSGDLTLSLVAKRSGTLVGHIAFSPASVGEHSENIYALGPVAVDPALRSQGIGTALIRAGLNRLRALEARACILVGDPNYYCRFGFIGDCGLRSGDLPQSYVQAIVWGEKLPKGEVSFAPAFSSVPNSDEV